jgi:hypothetical protein
MRFDTTHEQCEYVESTTRDMDWWHANDWFCNEPEGKAIIWREWIYSHWQNRYRECKGWRRNHDRKKPGAGDHRLGKKIPY